MTQRDWRLSRRRFLQLAVATAAGGTGLGHALPPHLPGSASAATAGTRAASWTFSGRDLSPEGDGWLVSPVWTAPFLFNGVGARWHSPNPDSSAFTVEFRAHDGTGWTPWALAASLHGPADPSVSTTDLVSTTGAALQMRMILTDAAAATLAPEQIIVTALDSSSGPSAGEAVPDAGIDPPHYGLAAIVDPGRISRQAWGANESYRYRNGAEYWRRAYAPAKKVVIHHTAQANNMDPAVIVRNLYYYHAVTLDWGDVGYNFFIDREGRVYEGRLGGVNAQGWPVVAGHAAQYNSGSIGIALLGTFSDPTVPIPEAMVQGLMNLVSYKVVQHGIHPAGSGFFVDKTLPNIMGHRDCLSTECPGGAIYPLLPAIRERALQNIPPLGQAWVRQQLPAVMLPGSVSTGTVTVQNSGSHPWNRVGSSPFRIGYRWFRSSGQEIQETGLAIHAELPKDVPPGQEVTIPVRVKAPSTLGSFTLKFDMIQEGVTWLWAIAGNEPLAMNVLVTNNLAYKATLPWVGRGR